MDAALDQLRKEGFPVNEEDIIRLSPFGYGHINMLGRYSFAMPEEVKRGELRQLRNPMILKSVPCSIAPLTPIMSVAL
jgi:hypothetical protein